MTMFCSKCGASAQNADSYCTRCGEWLLNLDSLTRGGFFRKRTREEKIRKMRVLEAVSAGLSLTAGAIIFSVLQGNADRQLLFLPLLCCFIVAAYQIVNFYLGYTLQKRIKQSRLKEEPSSNKSLGALPSGEPTPIVNPQSVVENTTELLEAIPLKVKR